MAKFGSALQRYMNAMDNAVEKSLQAVGDSGQETMKMEPNISDRIYDGRLDDSVSWATAKKESGIGSRAVSGDEVPKPANSGIVNIGTGCPYAGIHDSGGIAGSFAYGKNGNPANRSELEEKIDDWMKVRGIASDEDTAERNRVLKKICDNIENGIQQAYPFFQSAVIKITEDAPDVFAETYRVLMASGKYTNEERV